MKTNLYVISITILSSLAISPSTPREYPTQKVKEKISLMKIKEKELIRVISLVEYNLEVDEIAIDERSKNLKELTTIK